MEDLSLPINYNEAHWTVRLQYVKQQKGLCYHCREPLDKEPHASVQALKICWALFPPNFLKHPVHLHHDHETGMTIGAVHAYCNAVLWQYRGE